jgi:hypothetical protein
MAADPISSITDSHVMLSGASMSVSFTTSNVWIRLALGREHLHGAVRFVLHDSFSFFCC